MRMATMYSNPTTRAYTDALLTTSERKASLNIKLTPTPKHSTGGPPVEDTLYVPQTRLLDPWTPLYKYTVLTRLYNPFVYKLYISFNKVQQLLVFSD